MSVWDGLRRFLNAEIIKSKAPPPPPPAPRKSEPLPASAIQHLDAPKVRYTKERFGPRMKVEYGYRPPSLRKRVLVTAAGFAVLLMIGAFAVRFFENRRLPSDVTGLWRTDTPASRGRIVELRARYIAFLVDTTGTIVTYPIARVQHAEDNQGTLYRVEYVANGVPAEFDFVYNQGPPEELRFAHQRQLAWRKERTDRSLILR